MFNKWGNILRFEKKIYKRDDSIFDSEIFETLNIQNNEELILYYNPSENLYYHTTDDGKTFTKLIKEYGGGTLFTFTEKGTINKDEFLSFSEDTINNEEIFFNIIQKENLECNISETTGKDFKSEDVKKLKLKNDPKTAELLLSF